MAPRPAKRTPTPTRPNPLQRIAELVGRAAPPDRVRREAEAMVAALLSGVEDRIEIGELLGEMAEQLKEGVEAAQDAAAEIDRTDSVGQRQASTAIASLTAARDIVARAAAP